MHYCWQYINTTMATCQSEGSLAKFSWFNDTGIRNYLNWTWVKDQNLTAPAGKTPITGSCLCFVHNVLHLSVVRRLWLWPEVKRARFVNPCSRQFRHPDASFEPKNDNISRGVPHCILSGYFESGNKLRLHSPGIIMIFGVVLLASAMSIL